MVQNMRDSSRTANAVGKEEWLMPMEIFMKENGKMTWQMVMALSKILKMPPTQVTGWMIFSMVKVKRVGIMELQGMLVPSIKGKRMAKADLSGKMVAFMKEIL